MFEVFKKLQWCITILDRFLKIACGRCGIVDKYCGVVDKYDERRDRSYGIVVVDGI